MDVTGHITGETVVGLPNFEFAEASTKFSLSSL
jgi:hypothetical protein